MPKKRLIGKIISDKMEKTAVVEVLKMKEYPKYKKKYKVDKKYKAHNESGDFKVGDKVVIEEASPSSKTKKWKVIDKAI